MPSTPGPSVGGAEDEVTERLGIELWRFQHALRSTLDSALEGSGLSVSEYCVLELVRSQPGITASTLADQLFITRQALGRTIARLHSQELLLPSQSGPGPSRPLRATSRGESLLEKVHVKILDAHARLFAPLAPTERSQLIDMINRCSEAHPSSS